MDTAACLLPYNSKDSIFLKVTVGTDETVKTVEL